MDYSILVYFSFFIVLYRIILFYVRFHFLNCYILYYNILFHINTLYSVYYSILYIIYYTIPFVTESTGMLIFFFFYIHPVFFVCSGGAG